MRNPFLKAILTLNRKCHTQAVGFIQGLAWAVNRIEQYPENCERDAINEIHSLVALAKEHIVWEEIPIVYDQEKDV